MRKALIVLINIVFLLLLTGCKGDSDLILDQQQLPKDIRAISAKWIEDRVIYLTNDGVYSFLPSDGSTTKLMSADRTKQDIAWSNFCLSPDKLKYIMMTIGKFGNTLEIYDVKTNQCLKVIDTQKYRKGVGQHSPPVSEAGWIDNDNIYISTEFRLFNINITTGEEIQITEECSPITTKVNHNTVSPYLYWARNINKYGDYLYYNSVRDPQNFSQSIYCGNKSGETKIISNGGMSSFLDKGYFIYSSESKSGLFDTYLFNIQTSESTFIESERILQNGIYITNNEKYTYMTGSMLGGVYTGVIIDPITKDKSTFTVFDSDVYFKEEETKKIQFGKYTGAFEKNGEYIFLFSVENFNKYQQKYIKNYFAYSTKTKKVTKIGDYSEFWLVNFRINPSGEYIIVTKHKRPGEGAFLFDIIKSSSVI